MKSSFAVLALSMWAALLSGAQAQVDYSKHPYNCDSVIAGLANRKIRIFENLGMKDLEEQNNTNLVSPVSRVCINFNTFTVRVLYHCPLGSFAFLPHVDTAQSMASPDYNVIVDLKAMAEKLNTTDKLFVCAVVVVPAVVPTTPAPPPPTTSPATSSIEPCTSGPTRLTQYLRQDRHKVCERTCSFRTSVYGSIRVRQRTIHRCCNGEPILVSRASRLYSCP